MSRNHVNLLPWEYRRRRLTLYRLRRWAAVWLVCLLAEGGLWWVQGDRHEAVQQRLVTLERDFSSVSRLQLDNGRMRARLTDLSKRETLLGQLQSEPAPLLMVGLASQSARDCAGRVCIDHMQYASATPAANDPPPAKGGKKEVAPLPPAERGKLTLAGRGLDSLAVSKFVVGLRDSGVFERVELKSAVGDSAASGTHGYTYALECGL